MENQINEISMEDLINYIKEQTGLSEDVIETILIHEEEYLESKGLAVKIDLNK